VRVEHINLMCSIYEAHESLPGVNGHVISDTTKNHNQCRAAFLARWFFSERAEPIAFGPRWLVWQSRRPEHPWVVGR